MDKLVLVARILLGLVFFVFGLNGFLHFIENPWPPGEAAQAFMGGLAGSGYFFPFLKITETVCGALLLLGVYVPLALTILASVILNIALYHFFLFPDPQSLVMAVLLLVLEIFLAWSYRGSFCGVLARSPQSTG